jgi:hypothetical protein
VRRTHARLHRAERMFDRLAALIRGVAACRGSATRERLTAWLGI